MAFAFWAFLAVVVVVIQAAPVVVEEEPWNAEVNFGPEENFRGKSRRSTGNHLFNPRRCPVLNDGSSITSHFVFIG